MADFTTLISCAELHASLRRADWVVVDCRFTLIAPPAGRAAYDAGHIPGARYADLDRDLSSPHVRGKTGRHPLPPINHFVETLGTWGIGDGTQVVAYDANNGSMAARLWWLLQWLGHARVAVLDGGFQAWTASGYEVTRDIPAHAPLRFMPRPRADLALDAHAVDRVRTDPRWRVLDARAAERFRGENETIDPVPGRVPGARSAPWGDNVLPDGRFRPTEEIRKRFAALLEDTPVERVVCYCGSGVTAAHDVLAMSHAGLGLARLYPGSWSEWITDPARPVATG